MRRRDRTDSGRETVTPTLLWVADVAVFAALLVLVFVLVRPQPDSAPADALAGTASLTPTGAAAASVTRTLEGSATQASTSGPTGTPPSTPSATRTPSPTPALMAGSPATATVAGASPTPRAAAEASPTSTVANPPSATPSATGTPSATLTPTDAPSATPLPTYTPFPTQTSLPTYTPYPTATPWPTYTLVPAPTPAVQLGSEPVTIVLTADPDVLLGPNGAAKTAERNNIRQQILKQFSPYGSQRAGIALTFGTSPQPAEGNRLAAEVNRLLLEELPDMFDVSVLRDYHIINADRSQRGRVEVEVYFLTSAP